MGIASMGIVAMDIIMDMAIRGMRVLVRGDSHISDTENLINSAFTTVTIAL
jgi:hypothetical protein